MSSHQLGDFRVSEIRGRRGPVLRLFTLAVMLLAVWFLWRILRDVGLRQLNDRLLGADARVLIPALILTVFRYLTMALRWEILARREAPVGLRQIVPVLMAGNFLSLVTPVMRIAGPILRAHYLSRETGRPRARFYGTIVADQTVNFTVFAVAMVISGVMVTLPEPFRISSRVGAGMMVALVAGLGVAYRLLRDVDRGRDPRVMRLLARLFGRGAEGGWRDRVIRWWDDLVRALSASVIGSGAWWPSLFFSAISFSLQVAVQFLAFTAVGARVGAIETTFAVAGAGFIQTMSAAPGGPGLTEASLIGVSLALGIDAESAVAGVLLARFANYLVLLPWGGHAFFVLQRKYGAPPDNAGEAIA